MNRVCIRWIEKWCYLDEPVDAGLGSTIGRLTGEFEGLALIGRQSLR